MRLLVGTDLHNNARAKAWFCDLADETKPDIVVFLGDFITFEPLNFAKEVLADLASFQTKVLIVPGNCDPRDVLLQIDKTDGVVNLHNTRVEIDGVRFAGKGGSITCPSPTPFESPDEGFADSLEPMMNELDVLVLHQPVLGYRDKVNGDRSVGSQSLAKLVALNHPRLVLSGHIHEAKGMDVHNHTYFINPGPLLEMNAAVIEFNRRVEVCFRKGEE
jgi:putative phosphoesterase